VVQENPEDLLRDIHDLLTPDAVRAGLIDRSDEANRLSFGWSRIAKIRKDGLGEKPVEMARK
jgi:hypothetical protein